MPQARVTVNGTPGSELNAPINTLVQLDNQNVGGETTYTWALLDQPPGAVDSLSAVGVQNPTFTPKKEGSYLVRLTVNQGLATEQEDRVVVAVRQLKTLERVPAAGETTEADSGKGWAAASNSYLRRIDALLGDPGILVGVNASGGARARGDVLRATAVSTVKAGLPGEEELPGFTLASAATQAQVDELLVVLEGAVDGNPSVPAGALCRVRYAGRFAGQAGGPPAVGDSVYVSDAGTLSLSPGTVTRRVGSAMTATNPFDVWFTGMGDVDTTPIDRRYVVHGPGGSLPNAVRVDGASADGLTTPFRVRAGDAVVVPLQAQRFAAGADIQQWLNEAGAVLARVTNAGQLTLDAEGASLPTAGKHLTFGNAGQRVAWPDWYLTQQSAAELRAGNGVGLFQVLTGGTSAALYVGKALTAGLVADDSLGLILSMDDAAAPIRFSIDGEERWQIAAGGTLQASGGNRLVSNVQDPVSAQDAATLAFVEDAARAISPGGRLTLTSGNPVPSPVTGAGTVYYTPYLHGMVPLYSGGRWRWYTFSEASQLLSDPTKSPAAAAVNSVYDMFAWLDGATFRVTRGPAWSTDTSRGTGPGTSELEFFAGRLVNKEAVTNGPGARQGLYVGSIRTNAGTATIDDGGEVAQAWNTYQQLEDTLVRVDTTDSWAYGTPAYREAGGVTNRVRYLQGLPGNLVSAQVVAHASTPGGTVSAAVGVGVDSAVANSAQLMERLTLTTTSQVLPLHAYYSGRPGIGWHSLVWLEYAGGVTFYGDNNDVTMQSGIRARLLR